MIVVTHFAGTDTAGDFPDRADTALAALADRPGYVRGELARSMDDPTDWVIVTEWVNVGAYRRALGAYEVKLAANALLSLAQDLPTAFETLLTIDAAGGRVASQSDRRVDDSGTRSTADFPIDP